MTPLLYFLIIIVGLGVDQATKWWAVSRNVDTTVCSMLDFSLIWNHGVTWGIFNRSGEMGLKVLLGVIILIIIAFTYYTLYERLYRQGASIFYEVLVLTGAISNVIDRVRYGAVVDFIQFHVGSWYWPTFNLADVFIVCGIVGMLMHTIFDKPEC